VILSFLKTQLLYPGNPIISLCASLSVSKIRFIKNEFSRKEEKMFGMVKLYLSLSLSLVLSLVNMCLLRKKNPAFFVLSLSLDPCPSSLALLCHCGL
jgi:hypothetical protein